MKRMIKELRIIYPNKVIKAMLLKLLMVYLLIFSMGTIAMINESSIITTRSLLILALVLPVILILMLPIQWVLDIKPITDELYQEEKLKEQYPFYYQRFTKTE